MSVLNTIIFLLQPTKEALLGIMRKGLKPLTNILIT